MPGIAHRAMTAFLLSVCCFGLHAQDGVVSPVEARLERIELYGMALRAQQAAIDLCTRENAEAFAVYQAAANAGQAENLATLEQTAQAQAAVLAYYVQRLIETQQKLATEHDALADAYRAADQPGLAEPSSVSAGTLWEKATDNLAAQADQLSREGNLDECGKAYERSAGFCEKAASSWRQALVCARALGSATNDLTYESRGAAAAAGLRRMLRNAAKAYFNAYQAHKNRAATVAGDVEARQVGEEWLLAAQSHVQYERISQRLAALPE